MSDSVTTQNKHNLIIRQLDTMDYSKVWHAMQNFTDERDEKTEDELWLVQHPPVFTQGQAGKEEHLLMPGDIEVVKVDRGGQVTYHGPGQQVIYFMINLRRRKMGVRQLVTLIENAIVYSLNDFGIKAYPKPDAPGVYVNDKKIDVSENFYVNEENNQTIGILSFNSEKTNRDIFYKYGIKIFSRFNYMHISGYNKEESEININDQNASSIKSNLKFGDEFIFENL